MVFTYNMYPRQRGQYFDVMKVDHNTYREYSSISTFVKGQSDIKGNCIGLA